MQETQETQEPMEGGKTVGGSLDPAMQRESAWGTEPGTGPGTEPADEDNERQHQEAGKAAEWRRVAEHRRAAVAGRPGVRCCSTE